MSDWRPALPPDVFYRQPVVYGSGDKAAALSLLVAYREKKFYPRSTPQSCGDGAAAQMNKDFCRKERAWLERVEKMIQKHGFPDFVIRIYIADPRSDFCPYEGLHLFDVMAKGHDVKGGAIGEFLDVLQRGTANDLICLLNKYSGASAQKGKPHYYSDMAERLTREFANMMESAADIEPAERAVIDATAAAQAAAVAAQAAAAAAAQATDDVPLDEEDDWMALADDRPDILLQAEAARVDAEEALKTAKKIYLAAQTRYAETQSSFAERLNSITSGGGKRSRTSAEKSQDVREISALLSDDVKAYMRSVIDPKYVECVA